MVSVVWIEQTTSRSQSERTPWLCYTEITLVEMTGIEPATFWLQTKRSPN